MQRRNPEGLGHVYWANRPGYQSVVWKRKVKTNGAYKIARDGFGIMHQGSARIDHGTDLTVIARSLDGVLADHVNHLLVAFDQGYVVFEDLARESAGRWVNGGIYVQERYFGPWDVPCRSRAAARPSLWSASIAAAFVLGLGARPLGIGHWYGGMVSSAHDGGEADISSGMSQRLQFQFSFVTLLLNLTR